MKKYHKINTLYKRYVFDAKECPNKKWLSLRNKIIIGEFSEPIFEYLFHCPWSCSSKVDGTNCKIAFYPSTQEIKVEGKDECSENIAGMFEFLGNLGESIKPKLASMFPKEKACFVQRVSKDMKKPLWRDLTSGETTTSVDPTHDCVGIFEEAPVYIFGEFYGKGIQACGKRYSDTNSFIAFDVVIGNKYLNNDSMVEICTELGIPYVPQLGLMTLEEAEQMVRKGFVTKVPNAKDKTLVEEGIVAKCPVDLFNRNGERIVVKVKYVDYHALDCALSRLTEEEFNEFKKWYGEHKLAF